MGNLGSWILRPLVLAVVWGAMSCQFPLSTTTSRVGVTMNIVQPAQPTAARSAARVLLPNATFLQATAVENDSRGSDTQTASSSISGGSTSASLSMSLLSKRTYQITVNAYNSNGGTLLGTATGSLTASGNAQLSLSLLSPRSSWVMVNSWNPSFTAFLPANGFLSVHFDLSDSTSVILPQLSNTGPTAFFLQNEDGSVLNPQVFSVGSNGSGGTATTYTVQTSDLTPGSTGFLLTASNTGPDLNYGKGSVAFSLDPNKITTYLYVLGTDGTVYSESFNENGSAGGFTTAVSKASGRIKLLSDRINRRLYILGYSGGGSLDGYTVNADGSLTEIAGFPQNSISTFPPTPMAALGDNGYFYWADSSGNVYAAPSSPSGLITPSSGTVVLATGAPVVSLLYSSGSGYLLVVTMSNFAAYTPASNGQLPLVASTTATLSTGAQALYNPASGGMYIHFNTSILQWQMGGNGGGGTPTWNGRTTLTAGIYSNMLFALSAKNTAAYGLQYDGSSLLVTPFSIAPNTQSGNDGALVPGTAYNVVTGTGDTPTAFASDLVGRYLFAGTNPGVGNVYVVDSISQSVVLSPYGSYAGSNTPIDIVLMRVQ